jgi:hypothetical protein
MVNIESRRTIVPQKKFTKQFEHDKQKKNPLFRIKNYSNKRKDKT